MMPYVATLVNPDNFKSLELYKRNYVKAYNNWSVNGSLSPTNIK
jgi:hypothetical protein